MPHRIDRQLAYESLFSGEYSCARVVNPHSESTETGFLLRVISNSTLKELVIKYYLTEKVFYLFYIKYTSLARIQKVVSERVQL